MFPSHKLRDIAPKSINWFAIPLSNMLSNDTHSYANTSLQSTKMAYIIKQHPVKTGLAVTSVSVLTFAAYAAFQLRLKSIENKRLLNEEGFTLNKADLHK
jgi:hypothetical protein